MPSAFFGEGPRERVKIKVVCKDCKGSGNGWPAKTPEGDWIDVPCPTCKGSGSVMADL